ncbi:cellulose-binding domain-containing protein [Amycolatopsis sp. NBC_00438]|uniref:cellulose-binding domain-containing protein n=1 Tax=Amycolatopsis sp. NBC_00438 TaxID=2903558 RepID=UPI002E1D93E4
MARRARRDDDGISVDELLKATGATARPLTGGSPPPRSPVPDGLSPAERVDRIEQRAREAAAAQQRAGSRIRWVSAVCGLVAVLGGVVVIVVTTSSPGREASPALVPLLPATTPKPSTSAPPPPSPTPIPTVMAGRQTAPSTKATPPSSSAAPPPAPCSVRFTVQNQWNDGFTAAVAITNKGSKTLSPWTLSWTFTGGQQVTHGWDGDYGQRGGRVTVDAAEWNATLAPGATVTTGFNGAIRGGNPAPGAFTLNGASCDAG